MANGGRIDFTIGYKVDQTGINEVKTTLASLSKLSPTNLLKLNPDLNNINQATSAMMKLRDTVEKVDKAYDVAFDSKTGLTNIQTLNQELNKIGIGKIQKDLNAAGVAGQRAFTQISSSVLTMNVKLKQTTSILDKMGETFLNTIKWNISSKIINSFTSSIQQAWGYVQHLDTSLNDIRIVTGKSSEEMDNFAVKANDAAKALGSATTEYTEAALIFYQQGLSDEESQARAETTIKAANVTGQTGEQVSEELTAVWNGYKVTAEETELYVDKLAAVAATTAADLEELSTGMSKVASAAANMGVDIDQLNAQLATIVSVTRQAPESVGTALKTIYARIEDLKLGGEDEDGTKLGQVSSGLESMGIEIKDAQGDLRDLGEVIEEIGGKWDSWTESQQAAIAQLVAGKRQYNNLIALFDNWDMYSSSLETSKNAMGTLQEQQDIYMESTAAHLQKLKTQWEDLYDSVLDTDTINDVTDGFTKILSLITKFIDAIGGGKGALLSLGAVATQVFSKTIGQQLGNIILNFKHISSNAAIFTQLKANVKDWAQQMGVAFDSAPAQKMLDTQKQMIEVWGLMTNEEKEASQEIVRQVGLIEQEKQELEQASNKVKEFLTKANVNVGGDIKGKSFVATDNTGVSQSQRDNAKKAIESEEAAVKKLETAYKDLATAQQKGASASKANNNAAKIKEYSAAEQALKNMKAQYKALENLDLPDGEVQKFKNAVEKAENALKKMNQTGKVDGVNNALKNAMSQGSKLLETAKGEVQGLKTTIEQGKEAMHGLEAEEQKVQQSMGEMLEKLNTQKFAQGVSQITSGFLSLTSAATSFKTVLTTLSDENLSFTEKMSGAFTGLLSSVSMLAMSYTSLTSGLQTLTVATGLFTTAEEAQKAGILGTVMALAAKLVGVELDMNATLADNAAKIANAAASWLAANANLGFAAGLGTAAAAALGLDAALAPLLAVLLPIIAAMAALTIGITAAVIASKNHEKQLKKEKESLEYINKAQKERVQRANEEKEAINSLADSYNELLAQRDEEGNLSEEQTTKLYELVKAYGDQDMIIQALAGHYDALTKSIRDKQAAENDEAIKENEKAVKTAEAQLTNDIKLNAKGSQEDASGYDLYGFGGFNKHDSFRKDLEKQFNVSIDSSGHIGWEDLNKLLTSDSLALNNFLTAHEHDSKEAVQQIRGLLSDNETKINEIKNYQETSQSQLLDAIGYKAQDKIDNIESINDYEKTLNDLTTQATAQILEKNTGISESEAHEQGEQWARSFMAGQSEELETLDNANYIKDAIIDAITPDGDSIDDSLNDKISDSLSKLSIAQQQFMAQNVDFIKALAADGRDVDAIFDILNKDLDTISHEDHLVKIQAVLDEKSADKLQEKIDDLFADESFSIPFTQEEFEDFDEDERLVALTSLREQETDAIKENWEVNKVKYQEELDAIEKYIPKQKEKIQSLKDEAQAEREAYDEWKKQTLDEEVNFDNFGQNDQGYFVGSQQAAQRFGSGLEGEELAAFTQEYSDAMEQLGDIYSQAEADGQDFITALGNQWENLASQDVQLYIDTVIKAHQASGEEDYGLEDLAKEWSDAGKSVKKYEKDLEDAEDSLDSYLNRQQEIEDMDPENIDWSRELDYTKEAIDAVNDAIDELQGSYQSLQGIVEDYNEDGQLSLDNLQSLMTMDSQYVASLQMVNGELQLNDDIYRSEIDTKIDYLKYLALETLNQELLKIAEEGNIYANEALAESNVYTTETIDAMSDAAVRGKEALLELQNVKAAYNKSAEATNIAIDAYYNKLAMIDNLSSQSTSSILGSSSSSSSSSGSSSSSKSEPDEKDELKIDDIDLYRGINEELEKMESILSRIQEIDEHSWGASAIKALEAEGELLEDQIEKYEEKRELQEGDLSKKKGELEAEGIQFSEDGSTMTNASEKLKSLYEEYNSMVASYNAMSKTEQDEYEKTLEKKKEAIDDLEDAIDDYESLYSDWQDTLDTLLDKQYELIENAVSQFNATVDLHLELDDAEKDWNDFWYDVVKDIDNSGVEDKIESLAEKISKSLSNLTTLVGYGASAAESSVGELTDHLNKTIDEVKKQIATASTGGSGSIFGIDTAKSKETLTDYRDRLIEAVTEAKEAVDDIADIYLDMLDAAQDKIDKQVEGWESINDHLEHNVKLIKLISGENSYDALNKQYERQYENDKNLLNTAKQSQEFWQEQISHYQALMDNTEKGSKQWKTYSKALETATDNYRDSVNQLDKALEDALSNLEEWRKNQNNAALETLDRAMSGGLGLDLVEQQWKLIDDHSSKYLDNVEKAISLEQYTNELEKAANEVGLSAENQAKLNKFRDEELSKLNTKAKLTKYDIEESRARLEIMRQEMLLEEQKNNKSNMRLRRDSQGNYSYQYTGNEEEEEEAEDGLLTAKQAWYDLVKSRYKETREWILELEKEQSALLTQIKDAEAAGDVERLNYLKEMYETNAKDISDAYAEAEKNKRDLFDGTAQYFADVENAQILPQSKATVSTLVEQWVTGGEQSFIGAVEKAVTDLDEIQQEYLTKQNELLQEAGVNYEDLKNDGIDPTTDSLGDLVDTNEELAEQLEQVNDQLTQQEENLRAAEEAYNSLKDAAVTAIQEANEWLKTLAETAVETVSTVQKAIESAESSASSYASKASASSSGSNSGDGSGSGNGNSSSGGYHITWDPYGTGQSMVAITDSKGNYVEIFDKDKISSDRAALIKSKYGVSFKSGGYTGDWGEGIPGTDNGKLAVLHKKELVLNESDTSNILKAVDTIRDLVSSSSSLDLGGIAQSIIQIGSSQAQMLAQVGSGIMSAMSSVVSNSQSYNSNMTVNADFSGVRSAEAIYQALRELENYGSQQAYSNAPHMNKAY